MSDEAADTDANQHEPAVEESVEPIDPIEPIGSLGAYALLELLSEDELTRVYLAHDEGTGRYVTIRQVRPEWGVGEPVRERLVRAWEAYARLEDPSILPIQEVSASGEATYCVLPHVEGETLAEYVGARGRLLASDAAEVALGICRGMLHAHHQGLRAPSVSPETVAIVAQPTKLRPTPILRTLLLDTAFVTYTRAAVMRRALGPRLPPGWHWLRLLQARGRRRRRATRGVAPQMSEVAAFLLFATGGGRYRWTPWSTWSYRRSLEWVNRRWRRRRVPEEIEKVLVKCFSRDEAIRYKSLESLARALRSGAVKCRVREAQGEPTAYEQVRQFWGKCQRVLHWTAYSLATLMVVIMANWWVFGKPQQHWADQRGSSRPLVNGPIRSHSVQAVGAKQATEEDGSWSPTWEHGYHARSHDALFESIQRAFDVGLSSGLSSSVMTPTVDPQPRRAACEFRQWSIVSVRGPTGWRGVAEGSRERTSELDRYLEFALTAVGHGSWKRGVSGVRDHSRWPRTEQSRTSSGAWAGAVVYRSPEGRYVATVVSPRVLAMMDARSGVRFVDVFRGEEVGRIASTNRSLIALGVASLQGIIATVSDDGTLEVWRWESGERLATLANVIPHSALVHTFALLSPQRVANAEWLLHLDLTFASISPSESSHPAPIVAVKFSEGNSTLFTVDAQGGLREWNTNLDLLRAVQGNKSARTVAAISQPYDRIVTLADNGIVRQLAAQRGFPSEIRLQSASVIHCMTALQPESTAATGNDHGEIERWELIAGRRMQVELAHRGPVRCLAASRDGRLLATAGDDGVVKVRELGSSKAARIVGEHPDTVWRVVFSYQGDRLATAGENGKCFIWWLDELKPPVECVGHLGPVYAISFSPCGQRLATGAEDGTVRLWDAEMGREITQFDTRPWNLSGIAGDHSLFAVEFSHDGLLLAAGGRDGRVRLWRADPF